VLGAVETSRILPGEQVLTIELHFGDSELYSADEYADMGIISPPTFGGTYGAVHLAVDDVDSEWAKALDAGATEHDRLHDEFWGDRTGQFIDPFGHRWAVDQHLRDVARGEVVRLAAETFVGGFDR